MKTVLIANRGEIARRIIRSCKKCNLITAAVYSDVDKNSLHVRDADVSLPLHGKTVAETYLDAGKILEAAKQSQADAIHPGYGFLAENPEFAEAVERAGMIWIGPAPDTIQNMGDKSCARNIAREAGVPVLEGTSSILGSDCSDIDRVVDSVKLDFPVLVKAAAGGGGIGMQLVREREQLAAAIEKTGNLAARCFSDGSVFLEKYIERSRHIEIQVFGFGNGRAVHFYERDCSIQRRFQKIVEEAPAPGISEEIRQKMAKAAVNLAQQQRYRGAGTVEFIYDDVTEEFYFLEMNTRIQVEHPVTEMITGTDLIELQLRLANGESLEQLTQDSIFRDGHAIEVRLYAENPAKNFFPCPGTLETFELPNEMPGVRIESGVQSGDEITRYYDPMIAKLICHGAHRDAAIDKMLKLLQDIRIDGLRTNLDFLVDICRNQAFCAGDVSTRFIETEMQR